MRYLLFSIFICSIIIFAPRIFAQSSANADFNPFPQMEQDVSNTADQTTPTPQVQNDDWPPANTLGAVNSEGAS